VYSPSFSNSAGFLKLTLRSTEDRMQVNKSWEGTCRTSFYLLYVRRSTLREGVKCVENMVTWLIAEDRNSFPSKDRHFSVHHSVSIGCPLDNKPPSLECICRDIKPTAYFYLVLKLTYLGAMHSLRYVSSLRGSSITRIQLFFTRLDFKKHKNSSSTLIFYFHFDGRS
jgi:hypothetical protein